ncbi:DJ-1/PfpI family protein [Algoriphagus sp. AGSA1]|uniref:GlxA family transcriptional regulator n=1 Tax=Algoriphagus sp. AGSA1 TaxID=2907213 RepID=UPI001F22CFAB|nr:DJ-1/PfpI family protein [Algoriphagus sp. AGSA1]MCE7054319.1 DJ-1/PfpI family protein [Algoriphagus sp. AGSA1]
MDVLADQKYRAFFAVPIQVQLLDLSGPVHVFYEAKCLNSAVSSYFISLEGNREVDSCAGLSLTNLQNFNDFELCSSDWLIIPGLESEVFFGQQFFQKIQPFLDWVKIQADRGAKVCSVCTGTFLLAKSGVLEGKSCATHWKYSKVFQQQFPKSKLLADRLFVKDGNIYSSAGVASGIDLSLYLLEEVFGSLFAIQVAKEMVIYLRRTSDDPQLSIFLQFRNHLENRIHEVQDLLSNHLDQTNSLEDLAEKVNMSSRNLSRLFKKTTGITLGEYRDKLRLEKAVQLLARGEKVELIALGCGLKSPNQLRALLKKHKGVLPRQLS